MDTFELGCIAFGGCVMFGGYMLLSNKPKPAQGTGGKQFTDPTKDTFNAAKWELMRYSDSDFEWKETATTTHNKEIDLTFNRNVNVLARDQVSRAKLLSTYTAKEGFQQQQQQQQPQFLQAAIKGAKFYSHIADGHGCVPNDYGGPLFLLPGLIIASYICGSEARDIVLPESHRKAMAQYILSHQQEDGGWGTHVSSTSTSFGSILNYVALRLLGVPATHASCAKARVFLSVRGDGAHGAPLWAKLWLCTLGLYKYEALPTCIPPEMFLLPDWFPFHAGKTWCHARMVALPMSYLYGARFVYPECEQDATIAQLRVEIYPNKPFAEQSTYSPMASGETYAAPPSVLLVLGDFVLRRIVEPLILVPLTRRAAMRNAYKLIHEEDETNNYICIGPVNKALNMVCSFAQGDTNAVKKHAETMYRYLWVAEDGMKMNGYLNSMVWDSSFCLRALSSMKNNELQKFAEENLQFLLGNQVDTDPSATQQYRDPMCRGGWGFSTKENTYIVSDCTGEALLAVLSYAPEQDLDKVLGPAVDLILWMQNKDDHAWASYEKRRGYAWYEMLNPTAMFDNIMIDYSYVECTSSCMQALTAFAMKHPADKRAKLCVEAVCKAVPYLLNKQRKDGSWFGEWGVCFLYAGFFATEALVGVKRLGCSGEEKIDLALQRCAMFTTSKQNADGGWGESVESCALKCWMADPAGSNVVSTAWAVLSLCGAIRAGSLQQHGDKFREAVRMGASFLASQQLTTGDWPQQSMISGVFNKTCGITYTSYRNIFPMWALSEASKVCE